MAFDQKTLHFVHAFPRAWASYVDRPLNELGYLVLDEPFIRRRSHGHTPEQGKPAPQEVLDAVNAIQATAWRINRYVHDVMRDAWNNGLEIGGIPPRECTPLPPRIPDAEWGAIGSKEQREHRQLRRETHEANARLVSKRSSQMRSLQLAGELIDKPAIWFPHNLDFRGRCYPLPQDLNPQSGDFVRALLTFAEGKPIGEQGLFWLENRIASTFGVPWKTFADRIDWVRANAEYIRASVADPLGTDWWCHPEKGADEPWQFLATAHEWVQCDGNPEFVSHFPVHVDMSCNGLQHLALFVRDEVLGKAVNLTGTDERQDIYQDVVRKVVGKVEADADGGHPVARNWVDKITRKTVKRAVMTTPLRCHKIWNAGATPGGRPH